MKGDEAMELLGFAPNSRPNSSEVKAAYRRKVMESHPDLFPAHQKSQAETKFKQISEAYSCLKDCERHGNLTGGNCIKQIHSVLNIPSQLAHMYMLQEEVHIKVIQDAIAR